MESSKKMAGKRVLVTGAGTGIGRGVGLEFAREGAAVVFHYGYAGQLDHPKVKPVLDRAVDLILASKRSLGIMVGNVGAAQHWKQRGARFISITLDNITGPAVRAYLSAVRG
ncbi:MAG: hypothetical protein FJW26_14735 [Acidimicrobiia bacterium]|nr:hypothetical protein [Acidimicrobiia bacterium]